MGLTPPPSAEGRKRASKPAVRPSVRPRLLPPTDRPTDRLGISVGPLKGREAERAGQAGRAPAAAGPRSGECRCRPFLSFSPLFRVLTSVAALSSPPSSFPPYYNQEQFLCLEMLGILSSLREAISKPQPQMLIEREWALLRKWYKPGGQPSNRPTALSFSTLRSSLSLSFSLPAAVRPPRVASSFRPSSLERFSLRRRGRWMDLQSPRLSQLLALSLR